jgi:hypothetical protein
MNRDWKMELPLSVQPKTSPASIHFSPAQIQYTSHQNFEARGKQLRDKVSGRRGVPLSNHPLFPVRGRVPQLRRPPCVSLRRRPLLCPEPPHQFRVHGRLRQPHLSADDGLTLPPRGSLPLTYRLLDQPYLAVRRPVPVHNVCSGFCTLLCRVGGCLGWSWHLKENLEFAA